MILRYPSLNDRVVSLWVFFGMDSVASISSNQDFREYGIITLNHTLRKKGKHFKGKAEHRTNPDNRSGEDVFNMV